MAKEKDKPVGRCIQCGQTSYRRNITPEGLCGRCHHERREPRCAECGEPRDNLTSVYCTSCEDQFLNSHSIDRTIERAVGRRLRIERRDTLAAAALAGLLADPQGIENAVLLAGEPELTDDYSYDEARAAAPRLYAQAAARLADALIIALTAPALEIPPALDDNTKDAPA